MKLYIRQKVFSWKGKFFVKDENGKNRYYAEGEFLSLGKKLHIYDMNRSEVAFVYQKVVAILPRFFITVGGNQVAEVIKEFGLLRQRYHVDGLDWSVNGDFATHDYQIFSGNKLVVSVHKERMKWGDTLEIDIADDENEITALAIVLTIDEVMDSRAVESK